MQRAACSRSLGARRSALLALALALTAPSLRAQAPAPATHVVVVAGAGGEPRFADEFHGAALAIARAARVRFGVPAANVAYLGEDPRRAPGEMGGRSTRENVRGALAAVAARARPGDQLWVVLVGHGSGEGEASRFNLPGPDLSAADYRRALAPMARQRVVFVNTASASGDFAKVLAARNRVVVTATRSATERNQTTFARHFAAALAAPGADVDKNARVTLLEAFGYARREVARAYEQDNRLLSEHAQLDDDGDGQASADPGPRAKDGRVAATLSLGTARPGVTVAVGGAPARPTAAAPPAAASPTAASPSAVVRTSPEQARLAARQAALEARVAALRERKEAIGPDAYARALEPLLLELARTGRALRAAGGEGRSP